MGTTKINNTHIKNNAEPGTLRKVLCCEFSCFLCVFNLKGRIHGHCDTSGHNYAHLSSKLSCLQYMENLARSVIVTLQEILMFSSPLSLG